MRGAHGLAATVGALLLSVVGVSWAAQPGALEDLPGPTGCVGDEPFLGSTPDGCADGRALRYVHHVALSPDGRSVYTASGNVPLPPRDHGAIAIFTRDPSAGGVTQLPGRAGCIKRPGTPEGDEGCAVGRSVHGSRFVTVSPDGRHVYSSGFSGIAVFRRAPATGRLTQLPGRRGCLNSGATQGCARLPGSRFIEDLAFARGGGIVYATGSSAGVVLVLRRDRRTGELRRLPGPTGCARARRTRVPGPCAAARGLGSARSATVSPDGRTLYVSAIEDAIATFRIDRRSGGLRQLPGGDGCLAERASAGCRGGRAIWGPHRLTLSADGSFAYLAAKRGSKRGSALGVFRVNRDDGTLRQLTGPAGCFTADRTAGCTQARLVTGAHAAILGPRDRTLYLASDGNSGGVGVYARDPVSGRLTQLPGAEGCVDDGDHGTDCRRSRRAGGIHIVALSPDARFLYGAGEDSRALVVWRRAP